MALTARADGGGTGEASLSERAARVGGRLVLASSDPAVLELVLERDDP